MLESIMFCRKLCAVSSVTIRNMPALPFLNSVPPPAQPAQSRQSQEQSHAQKHECLNTIQINAAQPVHTSFANAKLPYYILRKKNCASAVRRTYSEQKEKREKRYCQSDYRAMGKCRDKHSKHTADSAKQYHHKHLAKNHIADPERIAVCKIHHLKQRVQAIAPPGGKCARQIPSDQNRTRQYTCCKSGRKLREPQRQAGFLACKDQPIHTQPLIFRKSRTQAHSGSQYK